VRILTPGSVVEVGVQVDRSGQRKAHSATELKEVGFGGAIVNLVEMWMIAIYRYLNSVVGSLPCSCEA
jgi:hypothetical protein